MLLRKRRMPQGQTGFTITELVIVITLIAIIATTFYTAFNSSFRSYVGLQHDASSLTDVAHQTQRIASVVRGATNIQSVAADNLVVDAYFYPSDNYPSRVRYYMNAGRTQLMADVTPFNDNPPAGTLLTDQRRTFTIIENFKQISGTPLFQYYSTTTQPLTFPVENLNIIKSIKVNLAAATASGGDQKMSLEVSLRNRKTNL